MSLHTLSPHAIHALPGVWQPWPSRTCSSATALATSWGVSSPKGPVPRNSGSVPVAKPPPPAPAGCCCCCCVLCNVVINGAASEPFEVVDAAVAGRAGVAMRVRSEVMSACARTSASGSWGCHGTSCSASAGLPVLRACSTPTGCADVHVCVHATMRAGGAYPQTVQCLRACVCVCHPTAQGERVRGQAAALEWAAACFNHRRQLLLSRYC